MSGCVPADEKYEALQAEKNRKEKEKKEKKNKRKEEPIRKQRRIDCG